MKEGQIGKERRRKVEIASSRVRKRKKVLAYIYHRRHLLPRNFLAIDGPLHVLRPSHLVCRS